MDDLDRRILAILQGDAHTPFRDIAARAETTVGTVHNRIKKMRELGIIKRFVPEIDARKIGYDISALVELKIDGARVTEVQRTLARDPRVVAVYDMTGDVDSVLIGKFRDTADLDRFVKTTLQHPHIRESRTRLVLNIVKEGHAPDLSHAASRDPGAGEQPAKKS